MPDTSTTAGRSGRLLLALAVFVVLLLPSIHPITSYDSFWHAATGRWILDHHAIPPADPFALASQGAWVDGEWLFQVGLAVLWKIAGAGGISILVGFWAAALFAAIAAVAAPEASPPAVGLLALIGWSGAIERFQPRPETLATGLLVLFIVLALRPPRRTVTVLLVLLTVFWMNVHPSAVLAPVLMTLVLAGELFSRGRQPEAAQRLVQLLSVAAALFVNPYFARGVLAPFRLAAFLAREGVVNREWLPTPPTLFPLVYLAVAGGLLLLFLRVPKQNLPRLLLFLFLSALAIRYVRNHGFFFAAFPLLLAPSLPPLRAGARKLLPVAAGAFALLLLVRGWPVRTGIDPERLPVHAVDRLVASGLEGHIYNPDQLGGYLIWRFYPRRLVLTDGRNELYPGYIAEYRRARSDSRAWSDLLRKYRIRLAVDEYRFEPVPVMDAASHQTRLLPASTAFWPRQQWALIAFDDVAMVFARRDALGQAKLASMEYRSLVPDARTPETVIRGDARLAVQELLRARNELGDTPVIRRLERLMAIRMTDQ